MNSDNFFNFDLLTILGPTAAGKTRLAVNIAGKIKGEIISADSRQVYKYLTIGTGKDLAEYRQGGNFIPYHLINIIDPEADYSVYHFQKDFYQAYQKINSRGKVPILCGGTGLYIESVLRQYEISSVKPNPVLRKKLNSKSLDELQSILRTVRKSHHNTSDFQHRKRMIRAIEIASATDRQHSVPVKISSPFVIGIRYPRQILRERITSRLHQRLKEGLIEEVESLFKMGVTHDRFEYFGLEYRFISRYLRGDLNRNDMIQKLTSAIHQFSKRQMTFFRHMEKNGVIIHWIPDGRADIAMEKIQTGKYKSDV